MRVRMRKLALITLASLLMVPFQNCSQQFKHGSKMEASNSSSAPENGTGYGGKVYVADQGIHACTGGGAFVQMRTVSATEGVIERDNCADLPAPVPVDLTAPDITPIYSTRPEAPFDIYILRSIVVETALPVAPLRPMRVQFACRGTDSLGQPVKMVIKEDASVVPSYYNATVQYSGNQERHMPALNLSASPGGNKVFSGNNAGATYSMEITDPTVNPQPWATTLTYSEAGSTLNATLNCYSSHY